jgi:hypothetical protein
MKQPPKKFTLQKIVPISGGGANVSGFEMQEKPRTPSPSIMTQGWKNSI